MLYLKRIETFMVIFFLSTTSPNVQTLVIPNPRPWELSPFLVRNACNRSLPDWGEVHQGTTIFVKIKYQGRTNINAIGGGLQKSGGSLDGNNSVNFHLLFSQLYSRSWHFCTSSSDSIVLCSDLFNCGSFNNMYRTTKNGLLNTKWVYTTICSYSTLLTPYRLRD